MKKNHSIKIKVSQEELEIIRKKSREANMTLSAFLRYIALHSKVKLSIE